MLPLRRYGVADRIEFVCCDFLLAARSGRLHADAVFLSPPWGGPEYLDAAEFDLAALQPASAGALLAVALAVAPSAALFVPRNAPAAELLRLADAHPAADCEVERGILNGKLKGITAYYTRAGRAS